MSHKKLKLYGTDWCLKSSSLRNYLQSIWIDFEDYNVEKNKAAEEKLRSIYDGELKFPTVTFGDYFLKNPSIKELDIFLTEHNLND